MRSRVHKKAEKYRITKGLMASDKSYGNNGAFFIPGPCKEFLMVVVSDGGGWDHCSVSLGNRTPTWKEMCFIKDLFWEPEETVIQYHPAKSEYVNIHPFTLHLWKPRHVRIPPAPKEFV